MNATSTTDDLELTVCCKAFSGEGVRENKILVTQDGSVLVWDAIAGYYTRVHSLSAATQARIRKSAR